MGPQAVLITDVVNSSLPSDRDRQHLDTHLKSPFADSNQRYQASLPAWFDYSLGDKFQAVFVAPADSVRPVFSMHARLASQLGSQVVKGDRRSGSVGLRSSRR